MAAHQALHFAANSHAPFKSPNRLKSRRSNFSNPRSSLSSSSSTTKSDLLTLISDQDRGLKSQRNPKIRSEIIQAIEALAILGKDSVTTGSSLSGTWRMLWTTEKEQLFIVQNAGLFGSKAGDVLQVIDVDTLTLNNVITFPPSGVFFVRSGIEIASKQRVNFRFTSAVLRGKDWEIPLPPFGQGWAPPVTFPRSDGKLQAICLPEDKYVKKFFQKHPDSKHEDAIRFNSFNPVPARIFAGRVLELKEQGVGEDEAMAAADMEYRIEKRAKKQAYARLKQIAKVQGKKPPPNPYPSAIREIQAEERKYVRDRFFDPQVLEIVMKLKETRLVEQERFRSGGM